MPGELSTKVDEFLKHVHPTDKERFRVMLMSAQERSGVRIKTDFRLRHSDNSWRWFELEAASVPNSDGRTLRCVGLLRDVSDMKRAHERLLHDAVHCSLTGLPNRELFLDRLKCAVVARQRPTTASSRRSIFIDLDKFKSVNSSFGLGARRQPAADGRPSPAAPLGPSRYCRPGRRRSIRDAVHRRARSPQSAGARRARTPVAAGADPARQSGNRSDRLDGRRGMGRHARRPTTSF